MKGSLCGDCRWWSTFDDGGTGVCRWMSLDFKEGDRGLPGPGNRVRAGASCVDCDEGVDVLTYAEFGCVQGQTPLAGVLAEMADGLRAATAP